jgi:hypothetical protein
MKGFLKYVLIVPALLACVALSAQATFTASVDKNPVAENDNFKLTLTVENANGNITPPDLKDFKLIFGPAKSTNYQFINGQANSSISFTYTLAPRAEGTFTIGEATAETDKGTLKTKPITLKVVKGASRPAQSSTQGGNNQRQSAQVTGSEELMAEVKLDKKKVYQGEQVIVTYYVYTRYRNIDFVDYQFPNTTGFYSHDFKDEQAGWLNNLEVINGKQYRVAVLRRQILFPQQHGKLTIDPLTITARVDYSFFNPGRQIEVKSNATTIEVLPLPDKPKGFSGDVGAFNFEAKVDRTNLKANDAITLTLKVSGRGNLKLVNAPKITFPTDFEVYDPKVSDRFATTDNGLSGSREFEYLVIPRHAGKFKLDPIDFVYFDTNTKTFKTISSQTFEFEVEKGEGGTTGGGVVYSGSGKEEVTLLGEDIRYIKPVGELSLKNQYFFKSYLFYGLFFAPILFLIIFYFARKKHIEAQRDLVSQRSRKAGSMAKKLLSDANKQLKANNKAGFYEAVSKALYGFVGGKLNIQAAELHLVSVKKGLESKNVNPTTIEQLTKLMERCEMARFAPSSELNPEQDYREAAQLIGELNKQL